jgi:hypothetical protein
MEVPKDVYMKVVFGSDSWPGKETGKQGGTRQEMRTRKEGICGTHGGKLHLWNCQKPLLRLADKGLRNAYNTSLANHVCYMVRRVQYELGRYLTCEAVPEYAHWRQMRHVGGESA